MHYLRRWSQKPDKLKNLSMRTVGQRIASLVTVIIFLWILSIILRRVWIVIWVQTPWWVLVLIGVILFLAIDYLVHRAFGGKR
jgi:sterol desaturase/sphingolipid hydroxylase (fatty acid hydroxylase superfamily)